MSEAKKSGRALNAFALDRRAFMGAAAMTGGVAAAGVAGAASAAPASNPMHVEPDLTDATSNAPSYWAHPKRAGAALLEQDDPLSRALRG
jgi:hypothetical protein